ncbi:hypothetical protein [Pseudomonas nitroreducens]
MNFQPDLGLEAFRQEVRDFLRRASTLQGGTSEVPRGIVAKALFQR